MGGGEREGGHGRDPTLKNMGGLMLAIQSRSWRNNLEVVAQRTHRRYPKDEGQWHCTCAHPERVEVEERQRENVVAEIQKA
jgi:hypothetical protein